MDSIWFQKRMERMKSRKILPNEIVFDADHRGKGFEAINFIANNLLHEYKFEIYYANGQKSPHLHVKNIIGLEELEKKQLQEYKILFIKKYTPKEYWDIMDYQVCNKNHLIAEENKPHYKYNYVKKLLKVFNEDKENYADTELLEEAEKEIEVVFSVDPNAILLKDKIRITDIALKFGLKKSGGNWDCPFHDDKNPSLSLSDELGSFNCFGCDAKGGILLFAGMLEDLKKDDK